MLEWYFENVRCIFFFFLGGGVNYPPGVAYLSFCVCTRDKFHRLYRPTHVFEDKLFNGPQANIHCSDSFTPKFKMAPENRK